ncbi:MAG: CRISPR-associated endonuclease Cas1 [Candidatus Atribacteria bacterium]|nr:CRISPR-associated endonuclease Cas1 [Candidatus Atribacteria bacterium]
MNRFFSITCLFESIKPITNLQFYRGVYWYALFQELFSAYFSKEKNKNILADNGIRIIPVSKGPSYIGKAKELAVNLVFPASVMVEVQNVLEDLTEGNYRKFNFDKNAHFIPGITIKYKSSICNICGNIWKHCDCIHVDESILEPEVDHLQTLNEFTILFITPLRLKRRKSIRTKHHKYIDQENLDAVSFIDSLNQQYGAKLEPETIKFGEHFCIWLDCRYKKTMGGIIGYTKVYASMPKHVAQIMVVAQYLGIGTNRSFGFGFFRIKELENCRRIRSAKRSYIFNSTISKENLNRTMKRMNNHSPGPDGLTINDLKYAGSDYLDKISDLLQSSKYEPGKALHYIKVNNTGKHREIAINNITDRLISKAVADKFTDILDDLFPKYSFAFRKGKSAFKAAQAAQSFLRNTRFKPLLKCDIEIFFPSIPLSRLLELISALFYDDEIAKLLKKLLTNQSGLPVGNPVSPVLSNLYLLNFDNFIAQNELRMIRFSDDFIIFAESEREAEDIKKLINQRLNSDKLKLNKEKTIIYDNVEEIEFLGYKITQNNIIKQKANLNKLISSWLPLFEYNFKHTKTIYITFNTKSARTYGNYLLIESDDETKQIAWNDIHRIVIIGKSRISGGAIRKAMFKNIPIKFLTITGRQVGFFSPVESFSKIDDEFKTDFISLENFKKSFMINIVRSKINNQYNLLRKFDIHEPKLLFYQSKAGEIQDKNQILGLEGISSVLYFKHLRELCKPFPFEKRIYHPPEGPVNVMLSFGYSLLYNRIAEILKGYNLNPFDGILHQARGKHMALVSDFLENYRFLAENITLNLINLKMIKLEDFETFEYKSNNFTKMSDYGFRKYIHRFEKVMVREYKDEMGKRVPMEQLLNDNIHKFVRCLHLGIEYSPIDHFQIR